MLEVQRFPKVWVCGRLCRGWAALDAQVAEQGGHVGSEMFIVLVDGGQPGRDVVVPTDPDAGQDRCPRGPPGSTLVCNADLGHPSPQDGTRHAEPDPLELVIWQRKRSPQDRPLPRVRRDWWLIRLLWPRRPRTGRGREPTSRKAAAGP